MQKIANKTKTKKEEKSVWNEEEKSKHNNPKQCDKHQQSINISQRLCLFFSSIQINLNLFQSKRNFNQKENLKNSKPKKERKN